jgi:hypothetical protein
MKVQESPGKSRKSSIMKPILYFVLTAIFIFTASLLIQPFNTGAQLQPLSQCRISSPQPIDAVEMNTVVIGSKVKTIHVEKHLFDCPTNVAGLFLKADVSIIIEKFEDLSGTVPPKFTFESVTCVTNPNLVLPICQQFPRVSTPINQPCVASNVGSPIEMNTVTTSNDIIKTIKAETQVFTCSGPDPADIRIRDITTFTDIFENTAVTILKKSYQPVICVIDAWQAKFVGCRTFAPNIL